jgi:hypothetical protein
MMDDSVKRGILARRLLATTCLTAVGGTAAQAGSVSEPPNFGTTFATRTLLPVNTTVVTGTTSGISDPDDFVEFQGLAGGTSFTLSATALLSNVSVFTDSQSQIGSTLIFNGSSTQQLTNTVPANGLLVVDVHQTNSESGMQAYTLNLTASTTVPEPASCLSLGLGLVGIAGALAVHRFRSKRQ